MAGSWWGYPRQPSTFFYRWTEGIQPQGVCPEYGDDNVTYIHTDPECTWPLVQRSHHEHDSLH
jgi:hypothetical protein